MTESKKKLSRSDLASFLAVILSIAALAIGIVEAQIMADQQEIMAQQQTIMVEQQKGAVWPYMEVKTNVAITGKTTIICTAENKGVGPAIVTNAKIVLGNESFNDGNEFIEGLKAILGNADFDLLDFGISPAMKPVFKSGEKKSLFKIELHNPLDYKKVAALFLTLNYCSIYDDCWRENGTEIGQTDQVD